MIIAILVPTLSYLVGSLSLAPLILFLQHRPISGSTGAANVTHLAGVKWGIAAGIFDFSKGFVPVLVAHLLGLGGWVVAAAGLAAVCGHIWPLYFGFRGGRGLNTIIGATAFLLPRELPIAFAVAIMVGYGVKRSKGVRSRVDPIPAGAAGGLITTILLSWAFREPAYLISYALGVAILPMISGISDLFAFVSALGKEAHR